MRIAVIESIGTGFDSEAHAADCQDVKKKWERVDRKWIAESLAEAKADYEGDNANFEAESGEGAGYYWDDMVKVYPCTKAGA